MLTTTDIRRSYEVTVATNTFDYDIGYFEPADLIVYITEVGATSETLLILDATVGGYSLNPLLGDPRNGCTITTSETYPIGTVVTVTRRMALTQLADFQRGGDFPPEILNSALDRVVGITQQIEDVGSRSIRLSDADTDVNLILPLANARAGKYLTFDSIGNVTSLGTIITDVDVNSGLSISPSGNLSLNVDNSTIDVNPSNQLEVKDSGITTAKVAPQAITLSKLADLSVGSDQLIDTNILTQHIRDLNVTTAKIADSAITSSKIAGSAITNAKLAPLSVSTDRIIDLAVTSQKINSNSITTDKIATNAVTTGKIVDSAITNVKIGNNEISLGKINQIPSNLVIGNMSGVTATPTLIDVLDEDTMASNANTALATQQSIKAYVDATAGYSVTPNNALDLTSNVISLNTDAVTIDVNPSNQLEIKDGGVSTAKIANNSVTLGKLSTVTNSTVLGNMSGGVANASEIAVLDEDTMVSDSATSLATQQSIKKYVDDSVIAGVAGVLAFQKVTIGGTLGGISAYQTWDLAGNTSPVINTVTYDMGNWNIEYPAINPSAIREVIVKFNGYMFNDYTSAGQTTSALMRYDYPVTSTTFENDIVCKTGVNSNDTVRNTQTVSLPVVAGQIDFTLGIDLATDYTGANLLATGEWTIVGFKYIS